MSEKRLIIEFKPILAPGGLSGNRVEAQTEGDVEVKELMTAAAYLIGVVANEIGDTDPYSAAVAIIKVAENSMRMMHGGNPQ